MDKGLVQIYCGDGRGKTMAALGHSLQAACGGKSVVIIQFLKGKGACESEFIKRLEPEIKLFRFEKTKKFFEELSEEEKQEETMNIKNGLNFAKKVLLTGECSVLVLDEVLGLLDMGIITKEEIESLVHAKDSETELILTGRHLSDDIKGLADSVSRIESVETDVDNKNE